jgi:DNA sulfur modification protein DndE
MIETVKLSERAKNQLVVLKRKTGVTNWNVLCRWGFCVSLKEASIPPEEKKLKLNSSVEMTWKIFAGKNADLYSALLIQRCKQDGFKLSEKNLNEQFKLHLHRGIAYLVNDSNVNNIADMLALSIK